MNKCPKCKSLYEAYMAHLNEMIRYFERREKYRHQEFENEWPEERRKAYAENRIKSLYMRKEFVTRYYKEEKED